MQSQDIVVLQTDPGVAQSLVSALSNSFQSVHQAESVNEVRSKIAKHRATVAIVDIEKTPLSDVERLSREFPAAAIVCIHRCADEEMWTAVLNAGACDLYYPHDTSGIVRAALKSGALGRSAAA